MIELTEVCKTYSSGVGRVHVLDHLTLTADKGEFIGLMGPSGSGKTTTLKIIAGLERADSGRTIVDGYELENFTENQRCRWRAAHVGMIFQYDNLISSLNVLQNVNLPLYLLNIPKAERLSRCQTALELVGLSDRIYHRPRELSGGQQQRTAIARAIVSDPSLILADEPTGSVDLETTVQLLEIFSILSKELGKTILIVSHDQIITEYTDAVYHIKDGDIHSSAK